MKHSFVASVEWPLLIDSFLYFNELKLLRARLNYFGPHVDRFLIVESAIDFSGKGRQFVLTEEFKQTLPWAEKIEVIRWTPTRVYRHVLFPLARWFRYRKLLWQIQNFQRDALIPALYRCPPSALVIFSDLDEFLNHQDLDHIQGLIAESGQILGFDQMGFYYNLKTQAYADWRGPVATTVSTVIEKKPSHLRRWRHKFLGVKSGWHFSYFGAPDKVVEKISAIADVEKLTQFKKISLGEVLSKIQSGKDLYDRPEEFIQLSASPDLPIELQGALSEEGLL